MAHSTTHPIPAVNSTPPHRTDYTGEFIRLSPLNPQADVAELYACSHGSERREQVWAYLGYGPFENAAAMQHWLEQGADSTDPLFFTVHHLETQRRIGVVSFLNIVPEMRRLEIGHIWYAPPFQRSSVNTEAAYLLLCEAFDRLNYRRVEWKCDSLNARSGAAAQRLGFTFEGIFRQHIIVKGRNRDTAWYSLLDKEWAAAKENMETWLYRNPNRQLSLTTLNSSNG